MVEQVGKQPVGQDGGIVAKLVKMQGNIRAFTTGADGKAKVIHPESGRHIGYRPPGAAGQTELISGGYLEKIEQKAGEKLDRFRSRVSVSSFAVST